MANYVDKIAFILLSFFIFYWSYLFLKLNGNIGDILPVIAVIFPVAVLFGGIIFFIERKSRKEIKKVTIAVLLICFLLLWIIKCADTAIPQHELIARKTTEK